MRAAEDGLYGTFGNFLVAFSPFPPWPRTLLEEEFLTQSGLDHERSKPFLLYPPALLALNSP